MDVPDDMDSDEELPYTVFVPGAIMAAPPFTTEELEDEVSSYMFKLKFCIVTDSSGLSFLRSRTEAYSPQRLDVFTKLSVMLMRAIGWCF